MKNVGKIVLLLASICFFSCSSLNEGIVSVEQTAQSSDILALEELLAYEDAKYLLQEEATGAKDIASAAEKLLGVPGLQKASEARLYAIKGRALLIIGQTSKALESFKKSMQAYKGDVQNYVLGCRLKVKCEPFVAASEDDEHIVALEDAILSFVAGLYLDAAAKFDAAFLTLPSFYADAYKNVRDKAWSLRAIDENTDEAKMKLLLKEKLSVSELVLLSSLSQNLTSSFTADKALSERELFRTIVSAGLLSPVSAKEEKALSQDEIATRIILARYIWNIFCRTKGSGKKATIYSELYRSAGEQSPVSDVSTESPDFDAVLGTIENELMDLTDGEHFEGDKAVSGTEAEKYFQKLR